MSHFTVLVIGPDHEEQLAPYDENLSVEPYKTYWDNDELERWEGILQETTTQRRKPGGKGSELEEVALPPDQILGEEYTLEDMRRVYVARYFGGDDSPYTGDPDDERPQVDDGGIYEWSTYSQKSKWDWYQVGGRWRGFFKLKQHALATAAVGESGSFDNEARYDADEARKGDVDIDWMRDKAEQEAADAWDRVHTVIGHLPEALGWEEDYVRRLKLAEAGEDEYTIDQAREEYHAQPRVVALKEWNDSLPNEEKVTGWFGPNVEDFQVSREEFIATARDEALCPYAYVFDGEWHAPGKMGWFGNSTDTKRDRRDFARKFNDLLDSLPDDIELTLVDAHI